MRFSFGVRVGPAGFRIGSAWSGPIDQLRALYAGYPGLADGFGAAESRFLSRRERLQWWAGCGAAPPSE